MQQYKKEFQTGKNSRLWLHLYKPIVKELNEKSKPPKIPDTSPSCEGKTCDLLEKGLKVLAIEDKPHDIEGKKLPGRFQTTNMKYSPKIRVIKEVLVKPSSPPLYLLDGHKHKDKNLGTVGYT